MASVAYADILTGARLYCDRRPGGSDAFISDTEGTSMVARSVRRLRNALQIERGHEQFTSVSTFTTSSGTSDYALPSDHQATVRVRLVWSTQDVEEVRAFETMEESGLRTWGSWGRGGPKGYRLVGKNGSGYALIKLQPTPDSATTVEVVYVQRDDVSATSADLWIDGWDEWVMLDVACMMLRSGREDFGDLAADRDALGDQLKQLAQDRAAAEPIRIVDVQPERQRLQWWPGQRSVL